MTPGRSQGARSNKKDDHTDGGKNKPDWFCRVCVNSKGNQYLNYGTRSSCHSCGKGKGLCHGRNRQPG